MQTSTKLPLTVLPDQCRAVLHFGFPMAYVAYRAGGGPHLFQASILILVRGGPMVTDNTGSDGRDEAGPFCQGVLRKYMAREYDSILCNPEGHPFQVLVQAVRTLGELTKERDRPPYVTEAHASPSDSATTLILSALFGGSLQQCLQEAVEHFGAAWIALAVERVAEDFPLPFSTGQGMSLIREELCQRLEEQALPVLLPSELCAHYLIYMSRQNGAHSVLFDNAGSIHKKLQVVCSLSVSSAVLVYP